MSRFVEWAWRRLYRLICPDCHGIIWPWQPRCHVSHRSCQHRLMRQQFTRTQANYPTMQPWSCAACGQLP